MLNHVERVKIKPEPCLAGYDLLKKKGLFEYIEQIKSLVSCPHTLFATLYLETIYRFTEFCQMMSVNEGDMHDCGLLKRQLSLAIAVLKLRRGMLLPKGAKIEKISEEEPQWTFALFAAALIKGLYYIAYDREIALYYANHESAGTWHILSGTLYYPALYYELNFTDQPVETAPGIIMSALMSRILPAGAIRWLSENRYLFAMWLSTLLGDATEENELISLIKLAESKLDLVSFHEKSTITPLKQKPEVQTFLTWLDKGYINYKNDIFRYQNGLFVTEQAIEQFLSTRPNPSFDGLCESLAHEKYLVLNENGFTYELSPRQFEDQRSLKGILVVDSVIAESLLNLPQNTYYINKVSL